MAQRKSIIRSGDRSEKIAGIPLIGNKLDLYDESPHELYDYKLDYVEYHGQLVYVFDVQPKQDLGFINKIE